MVRCNSRYCTSCFPPNAEERRAIKDAIDSIENETGVREFNQNEFYKSDAGEECYSHFLQSWSDDDSRFHENFLPLANAYEAGVKHALKILRQELERYARD